MDTPNQIVFYDGECMLCNSFIQFLLKKQIPNLYFSELQSQYAAKLLALHNISFQNLNTIYYHHSGKIYSHSTAVLKLISTINTNYKILGNILLLIPRFLRDFFYKVVAKNRHRFFKNKSCIIPTAH